MGGCPFGALSLFMAWLEEWGPGGRKYKQCRDAFSTDLLKPAEWWLPLLVEKGRKKEEHIERILLGILWPFFLVQVDCPRLVLRKSPYSRANIDCIQFHK